MELTKTDTENKNYNTLPTFLRVFEDDTGKLINYIQLHFDIFKVTLLPILYFSLLQLLINIEIKTSLKQQQFQTILFRTYQLYNPKKFQKLLKKTK